MKKNTNFILLFGHSCSGKSTWSRALKNDSTSIIEVSSNITLPNRKRVNDIPFEDIVIAVNNCYKAHGKDYFAKQIINKINEKANFQKDNIVICGVRNKKELDLFSKVGNIYPVGLFSSFDTRLNRLKKRSPQKNNTQQYLFKRDIAEIEWGMYELFKYIGYKQTIFTDNLTIDSLINLAESFSNNIRHQK